MFENIKRKIELIFESKKKKNETYRVHIANSLCEHMELIKKQFSNSMQMQLKMDHGLKHDLQQR